MPMSDSTPMFALIPISDSIPISEKKIVENSYHHVCQTVSKITASVYQTYPSEPAKSSNIISAVVKQYNDKKSAVKINVFSHMLKFTIVVPHLVKLLDTMGFWRVDCEKAYFKLMICQKSIKSIKL